MDLSKHLSPSATELIDWINGEGILDLDWDFPEDADLYEAGLDANVLANLATALEDQYAIELSPEELVKAKVKTPNQLAKFLAARLK